mmetsp:Transcript_1322/g.2660  ORF Transcript_1322/g.2660 Transcript_1322/m.2660 type:complete len:91 (+) Transcript_1322:1122-1394(+)
MDSSKGALLFFSLKRAVRDDSEPTALPVLLSRTKEEEPSLRLQLATVLGDWAGTNAHAPPMADKALMESSIWLFMFSRGVQYCDSERTVR